MIQQLTNAFFIKAVYLVRYFALLICLFFVADAFAQNGERQIIGDSRGKEFWLCFPQNARSENASKLGLKLTITSDRNTSGVVEVPGLGIVKPFSLEATKIITVDLDSIIQVLGSDQIQKLGVHVTSDNDISVFGLSTRKASTDTYLAYPKTVLGTSYRAVGYHALATSDNEFTSQINIVATEDHTVATITLTGDTKGGHRAGETYSIELNKGDVYQIQGANAGKRQSDLTGTLVTATKPIAFFTGHSCAQIPPDVSFCDQLLEMEPPVPSWGRQFYVGRFEGKAEYALRVIASENNTNVFLNNKLVAKLMAGEYYENNHIKENSLVTASKPILVAQYAQGSDADSLKVGDPFMLLITPTEQFLDYYRFLTPVRGDWHHYMNVVVPIDAISSFRLDGESISSRYFKTIGISKYAIAQIEINYGPHAVSCDKPIGIYSYGFGTGVDNYDSYGNDGGQLVEAIPIIADTARPMLELVSDEGIASLALIARDDRIFDMGLKEVVIIDSANFRSPVNIPPFDAGTSQLPLTFRVRDTSSCGFMSLKLVDVANNESYWVICRTQDGARWIYQLYESREDICPSCRSWTVQFVATPSYTVSNVTFKKPDYLSGAEFYNDFGTRLSGGFSGMYLYPLSKQIVFAGGIGYSNFSGAALARNTSFVTDSILYGDTVGARKSKLIEQFVTDASFNYITLNGGLYYYFIPERLYSYFGLAAGFLAQSSYIQTAEVLHPATLEYIAGRSGGEGVRTLGKGAFPEPTSFHVALEISPGVQFKLNQHVSLLTGGYMNLPFFDALRDINWHLTSFGLRVAVQYRH